MLSFLDVFRDLERTMHSWGWLELLVASRVTCEPLGRRPREAVDFRLSLLESELLPDDSIALIRSAGWICSCDWLKRWYSWLILVSASRRDASDRSVKDL